MKQSVLCTSMRLAEIHGQSDFFIRIAYSLMVFLSRDFDCPVLNWRLLPVKRMQCFLIDLRPHLCHTLAHCMV